MACEDSYKRLFSAAVTIFLNLITAFFPSAQAAQPIKLAKRPRLPQAELHEQLNQRFEVLTKTAITIPLVPGCWLFWCRPQTDWAAVWNRQGLQQIHVWQPVTFGTLPWRWPCHKRPARATTNHRSDRSTGTAEGQCLPYPRAYQGRFRRFVVPARRSLLRDGTDLVHEKRTYCLH